MSIRMLKDEVTRAVRGARIRSTVAGKARVHELAKELGTDSKTVLAKLKDLGEFVKSASSTVEAPVVRKLRESMDGGSAGGNGASATASARKAATPAPPRRTDAAASAPSAPSAPSSEPTAPAPGVGVPPAAAAAAGAPPAGGPAAPVRRRRRH